LNIRNYECCKGQPYQSGHPRAYLNWILFDEQFRLVPSGSGFLRVDQYDDNIRALVNNGLQIPKNGYLFVYLSNETKFENVPACR
jgi:hypothetical protein